MNEKSNDGLKPANRRRWVRAWLIVGACIFPVIIFSTLFLPGGPLELEWLAALAVLLGISLGIALLLVGLWFCLLGFFSWKNFKRLLFGLACLITLLALFYAEEDFRGKHAWNQFKREGETKGEKFDLASFIPPPVPDDQNFAMTPLLRPVLDYYRTTNHVCWRDTNGIARLEKISVYAPDLNYDKVPGFGSAEKFTDLAAWQSYYRSSTNFPSPKQPGNAAQDVLTAIGKFDPELNELREAAAARPFSRFPLHYEENPPFGILLPHLARMKGLCQIFLLRSIALMEQNRGEESLADLQTSFRLSDSIRDEPFLIDHLVRLGTLNINIIGVREALARHAWNDAQLAQIEKYLASVDILAEAQKNMRGERSVGLSGLEYYRRQGFRARPDEVFSMGENGQPQPPPVLANSISFLPGGLYYQNMVSMARLYQEFLLAAVDEEKHRVFPEVSKKMITAIDEMRITPYNLFGKMLMPALSQASQKSARAQALVDEAQIACALERYRLVNGTLPDTLDALASRFLGKIPNDVIDGKPLRYRKNSNDNYVLYSIGWNETDDGGNVALTAGKNPTVNINQGDWVWQSPTK